MIQTDIETKAQVGPHTAQQGKALQNKNIPNKKKSSHQFILHRKKYFEKKKENSQLAQTFLPVPRLVDSKIKRLKSWIDLNVTLILCHFKVILRICKLVNVFFIVFHFQIFEY